MEQDEAWSTRKRYFDMTAYWFWRQTSRPDSASAQGTPTPAAEVTT
jgi:hypothetical protein